MSGGGRVHQVVTTQWVFDKIGMSIRYKDKSQEDRGC